MHIPKFHIGNRRNLRRPTWPGVPYAFLMGGGPDPEVPPKSQLNVEMTKSPNNPHIHAESRFFNQSMKSRNPKINLEKSPNSNSKY